MEYVVILNFELWTQTEKRIPGMFDRNSITRIQLDISVWTRRFKKSATQPFLPYFKVVQDSYDIVLNVYSNICLDN